MDHLELKSILESARQMCDQAYSKYQKDKSAANRESLAFWRHEVNHYNRLLSQANQPEYEGDSDANEQQH